MKHMSEIIPEVMEVPYLKASIISTITMMDKDLKFEDLNAMPYVELEELRDRWVRMRRQRN